MASNPKFSYHRRLFIGLVVYSCLLVGCFALFQYNREKRYKADELDAQLQLINQHILDEYDTDSVFKPEIAKPYPFKDLRITVIDDDGKVIYDNSLDRLPDANHHDREEIAQAIEYGHGFSTRRHSQSTGQTYFYSATRGRDCIVRTAVPYSVSLQESLDADHGFLWFMLCITLTMCAFGYWMTRRAGQNIARLRDFARQAEAGERIYDSPGFPHDELGEISGNIVRLYSRLQQAVVDRDREHHEALRQEQEKIRIKRELTNNINHELKTPVASMALCMETLLEHPDMDAEKREDFLRRSLASCRRLQSLLADVSAITRLEDGSAAIIRTDVDLAKIVIESVNDYADCANGMEIHYSGVESLVIEGNDSLLTSVMHNLLDNAIAYSGGTRIDIILSAYAGTATLVVADNGIGVSDEHLPRLFERFYRVDKGRSRQAGGTGLGLAIVKNAIIWHGGTISVAHNSPSGLVFTINLPTKK